MEEIKEEFDNNNIAIPFEQLDVNLIPQEKNKGKFTMEKNLTTGSVLKEYFIFFSAYLLSYFYRRFTVWPTCLLSDSLKIFRV